MDPLTSILRNSVFLIGAKVVSAAMGLTLVVILPRLLGDAGYGRLHIAISLVALLGIVVDGGLTPVVARAVAHDRSAARSYLRRGVTLTVALALSGYTVLLLVARVVDPAAGTLVVLAVLGINILLDGMAQLLSGFFQAHERMLVPALARVAGNTVTLGVLLPRLIMGIPTSPTAVAGALVLGSLLRLAIEVWGLRGLAGLRERSPTSLPWRGLVAAGLPFLLWQALGSLYFRIDVVMLGYLTTAATVGWYGAATRLVDGLTFIADVVALTSYPVMARLWLGAPTEFRRTAQRTLELVLVTAVPLVVALFVLAEPIVRTLFTPAFANTVPILRIHAFTLGLLFIDYFLATVLMAIGRERAWLAIAASACVLNPTLNWLAIPWAQASYGNGGIGAAFASLTTEACVAGFALWLVPRRTLGAAVARVGPPLALAAGVTAGVIGIGLSLDAPWILAGLAGALAYLGLVLRLGLVPADVLQRARAAVAWRSSTEALS